MKITRPLLKKLPLKRYTKYLLLFLLLIIIISPILLSKIRIAPDKFKSEKDYTIEIRNKGFYPTEIVIPQGAKVTFLNKTTNDSWPASDPHPTHDYLNGFDPQKPIPPNGSWSYTFTIPGVWRYHDHVSISSRGTINVLDANQTIPKAGSSNEYCEGKCFDELIRETVKKKGIDAAYSLFSDAYSKGQLPRTCHWTAHQIGEATYELFREHVTFQITKATSYCGYGFYHGFLEGLLRENPDTRYALSFCDKVKEQLGRLGAFNCIHGIGHGFTEDPPDPKTWGKADEMLKPGIQMCEKLFGSKFQDLNLCLTGVYTVVAKFADEGEYGLSMDINDPFAFCRTQPHRYQKACYGEFTPKLDEILKGDIYGLPKYLKGITDDKVERLIVWVTPAVMISRNILSDDFSSYINGCRDSFSGRLRLICYGGTILGFFSHGEPEKEYLKMITFCKSNAFSKDEKEFCFSEGLRQARQNYSSDKMKEVCEAVPEEYKGQCFNSSFKGPYDDPSFE